MGRIIADAVNVYLDKNSHPNDASPPKHATDQAPAMASARGKGPENQKYDRGVSIATADASHFGSEQSCKRKNVMRRKPAYAVGKLSITDFRNWRTPFTNTPISLPRLRARNPLPIQ